MEIISLLAIVALAALIHASFQLSISVLTLLGGHAIGAKRSQSRVLGLTSAFVVGAGLMTILLLSFVSLIAINAFGQTIPMIVWSIAAGLLFGVGIAVWLFYYRKGEGTSLWIPRSLASYLSDRTKATKNSGEAFGLGLVSIIGELIFILGPIIISALVIVHLPAGWQLIGIALYTILSLFSLIIVWILIGSGHRLSRIQKWRESNKGFLQFAAGSGLIILGFYVYVSQVITMSIGGM